MLKIENLTISYPDKRLPLLKGLNFEVPKGAICLILGDSGSGKTTLCLAIAGLLLHARPEAIISGFIKWDKKLINQKDFNSEIAITLENPYSQLTGLKNTVREEIAFGLEMRGVSREEVERRIQLATETFGITHLLLRSPRTLSGGETQKIVIASSYVLMPELWVLDRPLTDLDPLARYKFLHEVRLLANQRGTTFIITEEPASDLYSIATHLLTIREEVVDFSSNTKKDSTLSIDVSSLLPTLTLVKTKEIFIGRDSLNYSSVQIKKLGFQYSSDYPIIFENLDITVNPGECLWITGPNGCGKTTLLKIIAGILKPKKGEVWINNINCSSEPIWKVARYVSYAFQNPDLQFFSNDVWSEVFFGPKTLGYPKDKCKTLTEYALYLFGLDNKAKRHPHDLNRSERKRLGLASAFAMNTPVIILDEPTQFQTSQGKLALRQAICENLRKEKTFLIATNILDFIW
jgi:energy-coupling factor transport system ATP-binding protein